MKKISLKNCLELFISFFKVGLLTFGGGYAMIPIIEKEVSEKHKWIDEQELLEVIAISESTPGPIAVNSATYIGYKVGGFLGALMATLGLIIPSYLIIFIISFFYKAFIQNKIVAAIFSGLRVAVIILLFKAVLKLSKTFKFSISSSILLSLSLLVTLVLSALNITFKFTTFILILIGIITSLIITLKERSKL